MAVNLNNPVQRLGTQAGVGPADVAVSDESRNIQLEGAAAAQGIGAALSIFGDAKKEAALGEFSDELRGEIEDFAAQPDRLNILRQTEADLARAREAQDAQSGPAERARVGNLTRQMKRLKSAFNRGAISSTEVAMRRNAMLRQAIAERPHLAQEYKKAAADEFGLYTPELEVIDDQLEGMMTAPEPSDFQMRFFEQVQDLGAKYGVPIPDLETAAQYAEKLMTLEGRANTLDMNAQISEDVRTITANQARQMIPDAVAATFLRTRGQVQAILDAPDSEMGESEKIAAIRDIKATARQELRSKYGAWLGTDELDNQLDPALAVLDFAEGVVQGTFQRERLDNQYNNLLTQSAVAAAQGDPDVLSLATTQKLLGSTDLSGIMEQQAGIQSTIDGIKGNIARAMQGDAKFNSRELEAYRKGEGLTQLMRGIADHVELNVAPDEAAAAATNLINAMLPEKATVGVEEMHRFKEALPILAHPDAKRMVENLDLDPAEMSRLNERVNNYLASTVVPNLKEALESEAATIGTRTREVQVQAGRAGGKTTTGKSSVAARVSLMDVVIPVWGNDGSISFQLDSTKVPEDFREDEQAQRRLSEGVRKLNKIYAREWNNITGASANLNPGVDRKQMSEASWNLYMQPEQDENDEQGE